MTKFEEIIKKAKKVGLTDTEKSQIRANLLVRMGGLGRQINQRSLIFRVIKPMPIFASLLVMAMLGGGVSFAAENSLPGEVFYPIKVKINEEVRATLALSAEAKADWEARRAERRLEELEKLAAAGKLNAETKAKIEANFEKHAEKVKERIAKLESKADVKAAADVSSKLETSLRAHGKILKKFSGTASVAVKADAEAHIASTTRAAIELKLASTTHPNVESAAEGKLKAVEHKLQEVRNFMEKFGTTTAEAEARLKLAEETIVEGKVKLEAKAYGEAFALFQKAHRIAQEAKLLMQAGKELKIDVREELKATILKNRPH